MSRRIRSLILVAVFVISAVTAGVVSDADAATTYHCKLGSTERTSTVSYAQACARATLANWGGWKVEVVNFVRGCPKGWSCAAGGNYSSWTVKWYPKVNGGVKAPYETVSGSSWT